MTTDQINLLSPDVLADPYPAYKIMRENHPVYWDDHLKGWVVTRYDDVHAALTDSARYSSDRRVEKQISSRVPEAAQAKVAPLVQLTSRWVSMSDPPDHTRLRRRLGKAFTHRTVAGLEPYVTDIVRRLLADMRETGSRDLMADFAYPLPSYIMADLFGFPRADAALLKRWWDSMKIFFGGSPDLVAAAGDALAGLAEMTRYFAAAVEAKRGRPGEDFISQMVSEDRDGALLSDEELYANLIFVLGASYSTTMDMIGNGTLALLRQRDQWELLVRRPDLAGRAVDELLRYDGPVQVTQRITTSEADLNGAHFARDDLVFLVRGAANRDPGQFDDPDRLDITRERLGHVAFGAGVHYCIGAALGRMVGAIAFGELARTFPELRPDPDKQARWRADTLQFRGLSTLPVVLGS